ncbi:hypothetical protein PHYBOEH_003508 [Phytophthora boehmeriae]|uniref:Uncharacterized protein n=1 Tax=Phytophthora boehmeriae TaxID=109152 RepID=A0A8T1XF19_9STRA|nr:hypothetical protein PHYBOEH_003508 [Phytophthora boehmeriae]
MELARRPSAQSRRNAVFGGWEDFLRVYEPLLRRELAQRYPEFTRALRGLERNMCLAYERQNAQVLATLQLKDKRIAALQKKVSKQHEQLDVVLDELERRATTVEIGTQVGNDQQNEPRTVEISVQTDVMEVLKVDTGTQTETTEESEVLVGLEKLEKEMKTLEERNMTLEKELQRHLSKNEAQERTEGAQRRMEERKRVEACLKILQEGVDMMTLSTSCVDNPLALFSGLPTRDGDFGFSTASTCVNLEHRLEAQAIRLEHVQECLYLWREAAVQFMKRPCSDDRIAQAIFPSFSPAPLARGDDKETGLHCSVVLRGVLAQMRQGILGQRTTSSDDNQRVIQEMAKLLAKRKGGTKAAAKVVQKWAGWEARHLEELRALRQSFAAEQAVALSRQTALLKQIDTLEQQQIDLQAEANALRKKKQNGWSDSTLSVISLPDRSVKTSSEADKREEFVTYPQLLVKLGAAEHSLLVKEEQLNTANETINALLAASAPLHKLVDSDSQAGDHMEAINHLVSELQRSSLLKVEFFRRREKGLVNFKELGVHDFELSRRDEKILLLQRMLMEKEAQLREGRSSTCPRPEDDLPLMNSEGVDKEPCDGQTEDDSPILVSKKPPAPCQDVHAVAKTLDSEIITGSMGDREHVDTKTELEKCLSKCAELTTQNANLSRRLQAEKESSKQQLKDQRELQTQLSATTRENSKLQLSLSQFQVQTTTSAIHQPSLMDEKPLATSAPLDVKVQNAATYSDNTAASKGSHGQASLQEHEALKDQLSSREQENLALVQSLYEIKEKYAQRETTHQKELRAQTAGHAESMETYMATVNETLSRIESGKHRLEEENTNLRLKVQHLEADSARLKVEQSQLSSKGVNTDSSHDLEVLEARIEDLELQLARERKLVEAVERNQQLEIQQDEHHETSAKIEAAKTKEQFDALQEWRTKIEQEFTEYQAVQCAAQQESDRRLAFLSDCVREFVRLTDATSSSGTKSLSTKELYDAVMGIARNPPRDAKRGGLSASQSKVRPKSKASSVRDASAPTWGDEIIEQPIEQSRSPDEQEKSELTWWRLRAAKMESYLHAATQQNETFEDTIERLELRMNDAKEQLSMRLTRETQLVSTLVALKDELATTKEQMVALAEKYQLTSAELERRQGEATIRGDETQRTRIAMQRKTELLAQQKAKVSSLQQELEQASKKAERLVAAEKQTALLQQKAKENTQQLLHIREAYERCRDDNVQLSLHVEKMNERHAAALARLKAARAESTQLRTQLAELKKTANADTMQPGAGGKEIIGLNAVSVASLTEETRALKRRVLQKQEVIASYKAKVAELDAQLERQRETMVKLARTNRELQQVQRQRQIQEHENASFLQAKIETQLQVKQEQLDGLRASVYDSFEAFVYCRGPDTSNQRQHRSPSSSIVDSLNSPWTDDDDSDDKFLAVRRWTDFSPQDLEELQVARGRHQLHERIANKKRDSAKAKRAVLALRDIESALETNPEDCRAEICQLLQCLCN